MVKRPYSVHGRSGRTYSMNKRMNHMFRLIFVFSFFGDTKKRQSQLYSSSLWVSNHRRTSFWRAYHIFSALLRWREEWENGYRPSWSINHDKSKWATDLTPITSTTLHCMNFDIPDWSTWACMRISFSCILELNFSEGWLFHETSGGSLVCQGLWSKRGCANYYSGF